MKHGWRWHLGIGLLVFNAASYGVTALTPFLGFARTTAAALAGTLIVLAELAFLAAVALLGRPFFESGKALVRRWLARPARPSVPISRGRHVTGVSLFVASFLPYLATEWCLLLGYGGPGEGRWALALLLASDTLFVISFFVLGGEFWGRVEHCFRWPGALPATPAGDSAPSPARTGAG